MDRARTHSVLRALFFGGGGGNAHYTRSAHEITEYKGERERESAEKNEFIASKACSISSDILAYIPLLSPILILCAR